MTDSVFTRYEDSSCHYTGHVVGDSSSKIALEICNGLVSTVVYIRWLSPFFYSILCCKTVCIYVVMICESVYDCTQSNIKRGQHVTGKYECN